MPYTPVSLPSRLAQFSIFVLLISAIFLAACGGGGGGSSSGSGSTTTTTGTQNNPSPTVTSISPSSAPAGSAATTVTLTGTGFIQGSAVQWNQSARTTTFVSSTQLQVAVTAADLANAGAAQIVVVNPTPGGGTSSATTFTVNNPAPAISGIAPGTVTISDGGSIVNVNGTGFVPNSSITWNGSSRPTIFVSATQLQLKLVANDVATVGTAQISVTNPAPGGGAAPTSSPITIVYPVPAITSLSPAGVVAGGQSFTLTIHGSGFAPNAVVQFNGATRTVLHNDPSTLSIFINSSDIATPSTAQITVINGAPGGGTSAPAGLTIGNYPVPAITSIFPTSVIINSPDTFINIQGSGFTAFTTIQVNGSDLGVTPGWSPNFLSFLMPAANFTTLGPLSITVSNPGPSVSNAVTLTVNPNPVPVISSLFPSSAAVGSAGFTLSVQGSNFVPGSVIQWNGSPRTTTYNGSSQVSTTISASDLQTLGNNTVTVFNPTPGGGTSNAMGFTAYLPLQANDLVYSPSTGLLYASVPSSAGPSLGNSILSIDPYTGNLGTPIFVGSEPGKMALSSDGNVLWVGLNSGAAIREVNLVAGTAGMQVGLGGASAFTGPNIVQALSVMPGQPDTVAVATFVGNAGVSAVTIYDAGVARAKTSSGITSCCSISDLAFDPTGSKLYELSNSSYGVLAVDATGITSATTLNQNAPAGLMRIDNGVAYLNNGVILDANLGTQLGVFSVGQSQNANGPVAPDSSIGEAFVLVNPNFFSTFQINAYDIHSFVLNGSIPVGGVNTFPGNPRSLVRWGQDGLAFTTGVQVFILRSKLVRDLSASLADLNVTASAPATANTGTDITYTLTVTNAGPVGATAATLIDNLPDGAALKTALPSQGSCNPGAVVRCNLGSLSSGSSTTVQITATVLAPGTLTNTVTVAAPQGDPNLADNTVVSTTVASGTANSPAPSLISISPSAVKAGSGSFTLTVNGSGFTSASTVQFNTTSLPTTFSTSSQLTATVDASSIQSMGWAWISVTSPTPGGGTSSSLPLTTYQAISLDTNHIAFDPFTGKLYASVPSTATQVTGNSIVSIDPATGTISTPLSLGSEPDFMTESPDGKYLYVGLDGSQSLTRVDLTSMTKGLTYPISVPLSGGGSVGAAPHEMSVMPGSDDTLAINTSTFSQIGIYDISGSTITPRQKFTNTGFASTFIDASTLYTVGPNGPPPFSRWKVDSTGSTIIDSSQVNGFGGFPAQFQLKNNLLYGQSGGIVDPTTTPPTQIAQLMNLSSQGTIQPIQGTGVAAEPSFGRVFILGGSNNFPFGGALFAFDTSTYDLQNTLSFSSLTQSGNILDLWRWGRDGLAFRVLNNGFPNNTPGLGQLILLRGPYVLPQWSAPNSTPGLVSTNPSTANHGDGNLTLSISGSNFVPGAVLLWNGAERTTTFIDATHLSVAIPASDLATAGTATLVVNNPGSANSASVLFTIN